MLAIGGQNGWTKLADFFRKLMGTLDPVDHRVKIIRIIFFQNSNFLKSHVQRRALQLLCKNNIHIIFLKLFQTDLKCPLVKSSTPFTSTEDPNNTEDPEKLNIKGAKM